MGKKRVRLLHYNHDSFITYLHLFDFIQKCIYLNGFESAQICSLWKLHLFNLNSNNMVKIRLDVEKAIFI